MPSRTRAARGRRAVTPPFGASTVVTNALRLRAGVGAAGRRRPKSTGTRREKFLKVAFPRRRARRPLRRRRSSSATCTGPTHANTSWDAAKFEICAHRWVHVGRARLRRRRGQRRAPTATTSPARPGDGGGTTTTVRLSLLRAPRFPDPDTDQGVHTLRLRAGGRRHDRRRRAGGLPDQPAGAPRPRLRPRWRRWSRSTTPAVVVESVKLADDRVRRRRRPAVRVARAAGRRHGHAGLRDHRRRHRRPAGTAPGRAGRDGGEGQRGDDRRCVRSRC